MTTPLWFQSDSSLPSPLFPKPKWMEADVHIRQAHSLVAPRKDRLPLLLTGYKMITFADTSSAQLL